jgi:hypothetical protein
MDEDTTIETWFNILVHNGNGWNLENPCSEIVLPSEVFKDFMPCPNDIDRMCKEYPGLEKAYEHFKTIYRLVEADWKQKQNTRL